MKNIQTPPLPLPLMGGEWLRFAFAKNFSVLTTILGLNRDVVYINRDTVFIDYDVVYKNHDVI